MAAPSQSRPPDPVPGEVMVWLHGPVAAEVVGQSSVALSDLVTVCIFSFSEWRPVVVGVPRSTYSRIYD